MSAAAQASQFNHAVDSSKIIVTEEAGRKFAELLDEADNDIKAVRVYVAGGGCSGMNYGMTFADEQTPYDSVYEEGAYKIFIDPVALNYMAGAEIDYVDDGISATFVFNNVFQAVGGSGACGGCGGAGGY